MGAEASGKAFLGIIAYLKAKYGTKAFDEIVTRSGELTKKVLSERIELLGWYPYEAFARFLETIQANHGNGDANFCRILGTLAGEKDLEATFAVYKSKKSPERFVRSCGFIWTSYYRNAGEMVAVSYSPQETVIRINNFKQMNINHCRLMEGWISTTLTAMGYKTNRYQETQCMCLGGPYHEFVFSAE
jgi:hypothetical protein